MRGDHVVIATPEGYRGKNVIARFWEIVSRYRITISWVSDALLSADADAGRRQCILQLSGSRTAAAAPTWWPYSCPPKQRPERRFLKGYGLTEFACVSSVNPAAGERRAGSIGLPIPDQGHAFM